MVVILSTSQMEYTTEDVMDWVWSKGEEVLRLNGDDFLGTVSFYATTNKEVGISYRDTNLEKINSVWYRRWFSPMDRVTFESQLFSNQVQNYRSREFRSFTNVFFESISDKPSLGRNDFVNSANEKFRQMILAKKMGIQVPDSLITNSKLELKGFIEKYGKVITKGINNIGSFNPNDSEMYSTFTSVLGNNDLGYIPDSFFPSLFQEKIDKEIELRVFYFKRKFYSMAIFSQLDKQTEVDFRKYNVAIPNRNVPFKLPEEIESKLTKLMTEMEYDTGSIDLILTPAHEFIFLEVNPSGQFGMVSYPCNYHLEEMIADYLLQ